MKNLLEGAIKMSLQRLDTNASSGGRDNGSLLSPVNYDDDAASLYSRSEQDTDSDDDELQSRARNSRELNAADRIVLMEEDDLERLVTDSRKSKNGNDGAPHSLSLIP